MADSTEITTVSDGTFEDPTGIVRVSDDGIKVDSSRAQLAVAAFGIGLFLGWVLTASSASKKMKREVGSREETIKSLSKAEEKARTERDKAFYHIGQKQILDGDR